MGFDQVQGCFRTDTGHTRDIVGCVAGKPLDINHLVRFNAELFPDGFKIDGVFLHGIPDSGFVRNQLHEILVPGDHNHIKAFFFGHTCQGADEIICFIALHFNDRQVESCGNFFDVRYLDRHVFRHGGAVGLVFFVHGMAKCGAFGIKKHADIFRGPVFHELYQHAGKPENRVGGQPPGIGKPPDGMVGAVNIGGTVDQIDCFIIGHYKLRTRVYATIVLFFNQNRWSTSPRSGLYLDHY